MIGQNNPLHDEIVIIFVSKFKHAREELVNSR